MIHITKHYYVFHVNVIMCTFYPFRVLTVKQIQFCIVLIMIEGMELKNLDSFYVKYAAIKGLLHLANALADRIRHAV